MNPEGTNKKLAVIMLKKMMLSNCVVLQASIARHHQHNNRLDNWLNAGVD